MQHFLMNAIDYSIQQAFIQEMKIIVTKKEALILLIQIILTNLIDWCKYWYLLFLSTLSGMIVYDLTDCWPVNYTHIFIAVNFYILYIYIYSFVARNFEKQSSPYLVAQFSD